MTDTTVKPKPAKAAAPVIPLFEMPKFDIPNFDLPRMEVPAAFREFAEKGVAHALDGRLDAREVDGDLVCKAVVGHRRSVNDR